MSNSKEEEIKLHEGIMEKLRNHNDTSDEVERLLKVYSVKVKHDTNMKNLAKCKDDTLHATAVFLGGKPLDDSGDPRYRTRDSLIDWIIMAIEGLFPQDCSACKSQYTLERGDSPKFRCASCGGGSHDCEQIRKQSLLTTPGFVWVCGGCIRKFDLETLTGPGDAEKPPPSATSERKFSYPMNETIDESKEKEEEQKEEEEPADETSSPVKIEDVCTFHLRKKCRHGRYGTKKWRGAICQKKHPEICRKYSNYGTTRHVGCNRGTECRFFHPPLCRSSETRRECLKVDCQHQHLKHTRRTADDGGWQIAGDRKRNRNTSGDSLPRTRNRSGNRARSSSRTRNASNSSRTDWNRSRNPSREETDSRSKDEDFFERLLVRLSDKLSGLVANEVSKQKIIPNQPNVSWNIPHGIPHGMTLTQGVR